MDKQKTSVIDAYVRLGCAQSDMLLEQAKSESLESSADSTAESTSVTVEDVEETVKSLQKWVELTDSKVWV